MVVNRISKMSKAEPKPLDLDKPECELNGGTISERAMWAEKMAVTHNPVRCSKHNLFHNWQSMMSDQVRAEAGRSNGIRFDAYVEVSPGKWLLRDAKPKPKPKTNKKFSDD